MRRTILLFSCLCTLVAFTACEKNAGSNFYYYAPREYCVIRQYLNLPDYAVDYTVRLSKNLRVAGLVPAAVNSEQAQLGRVLFYDKHLSSDGSTACASCHKQELAFSDSTDFSSGVARKKGTRNAIALGSVANFAAYYGKDLYPSSFIPYFWDNRANTAADQSAAAMHNPREMNMSEADIAAVVQQLPYYEPLFKRAFGDPSVSFYRVTVAMSNFINSLGSYQSRYDVGASAFDYWVGDVPFFNFTQEENHGKTVYFKHCAACHTGDMGRPFILNTNNGLQANTTDPGVGGITGLEKDMGTFKVPVLRNIALTAPYMHDGSLKTLEAVIEHYNTGIQPHPNLNYGLRDAKGAPIQMNMSETDKKDLIAFLNTLTDESFLKDERFSDPFLH
jgi:cytochrome c peroxidase